MKRYVLFILAGFLSITAFSQQEKYSKTKVVANHQQMMQLAAQGFDLTEGIIKPGHFWICDFSETELQKINDAGLSYEVVVEDVAKYYVDRNIGKSTDVNDYKGADEWEVPENFDFGSMSGHLTWDEALVHLDNMSTLFPDLITQKESIGQSIEGRDLWMLKISDNPGVNEDEPEVLYTSLHHAREPAGLMTVIYYMYYLLENYDTDPFIQTLVDNTEMYFIPTVNPDGYVYNEQTNPNGGGMWRKNRRDNEGSNCWGVDPNRNYGYMWGLDNTGSSPDPCDETYRGESAFSEPELAAMRDFCEDHEFLNALNYHTYSNLLIYAWGYTPEFSPDEDVFAAHSVLYTQDNGYTYGAGGPTLYPTNGGSDDWMYGEQVTKPKTLAYTPELGGGDDGFWCAIDRIIPIAQENMIQNLLAAAFAGKYLDVQETSPTIFETTSGSIDFVATRLGLMDGGTYTIELEPLSDVIQGVGDAVVITDPDILEMTSESIGFVLDAGITSGSIFEFVLHVDNGDYVMSDTISKVYGTTVALYEDDCNTFDNWVSPNWEVTTASYHSPSGSITDSPSGNYPNSSTSAAFMNGEIDLTEVAYAQLSFWAKWEIEQGYDYVQLMISTNSGASWTPLEGNYTVQGNSNQAPGQPLYDGFQSDWVQEEIDLTEYIGESITFRFMLKSDNWVTEDGFYFDDFTVLVIENATTGLDENQVFAKHLISNPLPNPASKQVSVFFDTNTSAEFIVFNAAGQTIYTETVTATDNKVQFSVADWQKGIYFYQLKGEAGQSATRKLIVY